jgi:hypothetical protein
MTKKAVDKGKKLYHSIVRESRILLKEKVYAEPKTDDNMKKAFILSLILVTFQVVAQDNGASSNGGTTINPEIENLGGFKPDVNTFNPDYQQTGTAFSTTETPNNHQEFNEMNWSGRSNNNDIVIRTEVEVTYNLYPNPATDHVIVDLQQRVDGTLELLNLVGQVLYSTNINNSLIRIELNDVEPGVYFISVTSGDQRVIKKLKIH